MALDSGSSLHPISDQERLQDQAKKLTNSSEEAVLAAEHYAFYNGVLVVRTNGDRSGSFGVIFLTRETNTRSYPEDMVRHEYGHIKQLEQLGVAKYFLCIFIPSWQKWGSKDYYNKPWEITADSLGSVQSRPHTNGDISEGFAYLDASSRLGPLVWMFIE